VSFEIHLDIQEDSRQGRLISDLVRQEHITPSQAVERLIERAAEPSEEETPAQLVARIQARKLASGKMSRPPADPSGSEKLIGMLAGNEEFSRAMDEIIASRAERYFGA